MIRSMVRIFRNRIISFDFFFVSRFSFLFFFLNICLFSTARSYLRPCRVSPSRLGPTVPSGLEVERDWSSDWSDLISITRNSMITNRQASRTRVQGLFIFNWPHSQSDTLTASFLIPHSSFLIFSHRLSPADNENYIFNEEHFCLYIATRELSHIAQYERRLRTR